MTKTATAPALLDTKGVAEHLGVTERHVRRLVQERRIPFVKWGHYVRFNLIDITKWIESATVQPRNDADRWW